MRSAAHVSGHPIHPALVAFPVAYLIGSACVDAGARASGRRDWFRTARHLNTLGLGSALAAAVPGVIDYLLAVPPKSSARNRATSHMFANVSALALFAASRLGRRTRDDRPAAWAVAAELCGAGLVAVGGWLGGTLVYRNQIAVDHRYANAGRWRTASLRRPKRRDAPIDVGEARELKPDQMKLVHVDGERIVVGRTENGFAAFADRCTHKGGPLSDGSLACGTVQCPWHGSQFDVETGEVRQGPAEEPIAAFEATQIGDRVAVEGMRPPRGPRRLAAKR